MFCLTCDISEKAKNGKLTIEDLQGGTFTISNGGVYSDATTATLAISNSTGLDGNQYRCVVSATGAADVTSSAATLTVA